MRIDTMIQSLTMLAKADAIIAEAEFKARLAAVAFGAVALCLAVFGLVMLGVAAFLLLTDMWGPIWAALAVNGGVKPGHCGGVKAGQRRGCGAGMEMAPIGAISMPAAVLSIRA